MRIKLTSCSLLPLFSLLLSLSSQQFQERVFTTGDSNGPRRLFHMHLQSASVFGNSTELMYFYANVFVGSQRQKQSLIIDTGSGVTAFPCQNYCTSCGTHLNSYFDLDQSTSKYVYSCTEDEGCTCINQNKCQFKSSYGEGSAYIGFKVRDQIHFGESYHAEQDAFNFTFACATQETNLFREQKADGILGLTKQTNQMHMRPIFDIMKEANLIESKIFSLCLGQDGGYFQIGGYDQQGHIGQIQWMPMLNKSSYQIGLEGISMNNHLINGSRNFDVGFVDSGTTFTYVPVNLFTLLVIHFDWFCSLDEENHCKGKRIKATQDSSTICFSYDQKQYPYNKEGLKKYLMSYPVLNFNVRSRSSEKVVLKWFPSEYLYRAKQSEFCMAVEKTSRHKYVLMGGTFLRQKNVIFDIDNNRLGVAQASCNDDEQQIKNETEMIESGQRYGLDPFHIQSQSQVCLHIPDNLSQQYTAGTTQDNRKQKGQLTGVDYFFSGFIGLLLLILLTACIYSRCTKSKPKSQDQISFTPATSSNKRRSKQQSSSVQREQFILQQEIELQHQPSNMRKHGSDDNVNRQKYYMEFNDINNDSVDETDGQTSQDED